VVWVPDQSPQDWPPPDAAEGLGRDSSHSLRRKQLWSEDLQGKETWGQPVVVCGTGKHFVSVQDLMWEKWSFGPDTLT
jgi:hypothetical protein